MSLKYADDKLIRGSELLELYAEAGWANYKGRDPARVEAAIRGSEHFISCRDGARLVGFVMGVSDGVLYAHVTELLVRKGYEDKGVDRVLLERFLAASGPLQCVTVFGEPAVEGLYRELGFRPLGGGLMLWKNG